MYTETAMDTSFHHHKRRFEEVETHGHYRKIKTERSWSSESTSSHLTTRSSVTVKMEVDDHHAVDEETSNAASILNGVSMGRRTVAFLRSHADSQIGTPPSPVRTYSTPFWSQVSQVARSFL